MPLDGGQLFNLFIARFPYLQVVFEMLSGLLFTLIFGVALQAPLCAAIGIFLCINAMAHISTARLKVQLRKNLETREGLPGENEMVTELFRLLKEPPFGAFPFMKKFQICRALMANFPCTLPSTWLIIGTFLFYCSLIALPVLYFAIVLLLGTMRAHWGI